MSWLVVLRHQVDKTNREFHELGTCGLPVPFFGDIRTARVLTVGVNPSPTEFHHSRWHNIANDTEWADRLINYFHNPTVPWHSWFLPWESALRLLGYSYENGTAAHLDLSPRATRVMSKIGTNLRPKFCSMVKSDVHWLFEAFEFATSARLVLTAGGMIEPEPRNWLPIGGYLQRHQEQFRAANYATVNHSLLQIGSKTYKPMHSFTSGPAAKYKLIEDVFAAREQLLPFLR